MNTKSKIHQTKLAKWAALIQEQSESKLTVKEWCHQNNFSIHVYNYWKHLLKEEAVKSMIPDIVPIAEVPQAILSPAVLLLYIYCEKFSKPIIKNYKQNLSLRLFLL